MTGRIDMTAVAPERLRPTLDVVFEETQQTYPKSPVVPWFRRWWRQGRNQHRATKYSQVPAGELIAQDAAAVRSAERRKPGCEECARQRRLAGVR